ncbi:Uncharacterised protein [Streptococcus pneumoniae]|nr:Uncharacterised protein [Streptococcus pneumoniae]CWL30087.1 Uncharacterised protein [Streptococcus pneumoniae]VMK03426.1 Uncharacterised protein [Streptococcus pneumoniae]
MLYMVQIQKSQLSEKLLFGFKSGLAQSNWLKAHLNRKYSQLV